MPSQVQPDQSRALTSRENLETEIIGKSRAIQQLRGRVCALADLRVPVLIRGESGTGRRHTARALHRYSRGPRLDLVFVQSGTTRPPSVNPHKCFVLLDVDLQTPTEQARWADLLSRAEREQPEAPGRVVATASRSLLGLAHEEDFHPDLAERLSRFNLDLPPLRERREDIAPLAHALTDRAGVRLRGTGVRLTPGAIALLAAQTWPGNVQELSVAIDKLVAFCGESQITRSLVRSLLDENPKGVASSRRLQVQQQREELTQLIRKTGGNLAEVARRLDMSRGGVIYRAQKFGLLPKRG